MSTFLVATLGENTDSLIASIEKHEHERAILVDPTGLD